MIQFDIPWEGGGDYDENTIFTMSHLLKDHLSLSQK
jgi:hypothetical protein